MKRSLLEIHIAVVLFGLAGLFGKLIPLSPIMIVLGRVFFASITLFTLILLTKQNLMILPKRDYLFFISLGVILSAHWIAFFTSIQVSTVAVGLLSYSSFPVFTAFLEPLFFKEKIDKFNILCAAFCVAGVYLIVPQFDFANTVFQGVLWGLLAGLTFSVLTIGNRKLSQRHSSLIIAFSQDFFATLILFPLYFVIKPVLSAKDILLLIVLGVFCTAVSHTLFIGAMRRIKAQTASIISALEPAYGIILASILLKEIPSVGTILGGVVILGTAFTVTVRATRKP